MAAKRTLLEETERLVHDIVRDARKAKQVGTNADNTPNMVMPDISERVKAATIALHFMRTKELIDPSKEESDFDRDLAEFHGQGEGDGATATPTARNGHAHG